MKSKGPRILPSGMLLNLTHHCKYLSMQTIAIWLHIRHSSFATQLVVMTVARVLTVLCLSITR